MAFLSQVEQVADQGDPAQPSYRLSWRDNAGGVPCYLERDFGVGNAAAIKFESKFRANSVGSEASVGFIVCRPDSGVGALARVLLSSGAWTISLGSTASFASIAASMFKTSALTGMAADTWFKMVIDVTKNADGTLTIKAEVFDTTGVTSKGSVTGSLDVELGGHCGFYGVAYSQLGGTSQAWFDDIRVRATGSTNYVPINTATNYVYTFVNDLGEESAPSPVSSDILRPDGVSVTVTMPTATPIPGDAATYTITQKRIYRAVSGATGDLYRFIAEVTLSTATYTDSFDDGELLSSDVLESEEFDMPPADLQGIIVLPFGALAGFSKNRLCISVAGRPHAWPVRARYSIDTDIVAILNIDNTIVIGSKKFLYTATGNDTFSYTMSQPGAPQACLSKRGMVFLDGQGICFPSPDGYQVCRGSASAVSNLTEGMFTQEQWQALNPETINAAVHDGVLHFHYEGDAGNASYAIDIRQTGSGLTQFSFFATALHVDPERDALFMSLASISEPDDIDLPVRPTFTLAQTETDPYFANVLYLHHFNNIAAPTTIVDVQGNTWTRNSSPSDVLEQQTTNIKFGSGSLRAADTIGGVPNITRAYASTPLDASGQNKFTIDGWMLASVNGVSVIGFRLTSANFCELNIQAHVVTFKAYINGSLRTTAGWAVDSNYHFIEGNYDGTTMRLFGDGVLRASLAVSPGTALSLDTGRIGMTSASVPDQVFVDEARLTIGVARHPADTSYSVPTAAFPDTSVSSVAPAIYRFNAHATAKLIYRYRGKLYEMPYPALLEMAQVKAAAYANLMVRFFGDGAQVKEKVLTGRREFLTKQKDAYETYEYELLGTSRVREIQAAEDVRELT